MSYSGRYNGKGNKSADASRADYGPGTREYVTYSHKDQSDAQRIVDAVKDANSRWNWTDLTVVNQPFLSNGAANVSGSPSSVYNLTENLKQSNGAKDSAQGTKIYPKAVNIRFTVHGTTDASIIRELNDTIQVLILQTTEAGLPDRDKIMQANSTGGVLGTSTAPLSWIDCTRSTPIQKRKMFFTKISWQESVVTVEAFLPGYYFDPITTANATDMGKRENLRSGGIFVFPLSSVDSQADQAVPRISIFCRTWYTSQ